MSMKGQAQQSTGSATVRSLTQNAPEGVSTIFEVADIVGGGKKLEVSRRSLQPEEPREPQLARTPPASHTFHAATGFIEYLDRFASDQCVVLIDPGSRVVEAILSEPQAGQPRPTGGREIVSFRPQLHPRWEPWAALLGSTQRIQEFVAFLRNNRRSIVEPDGRELTLTLSQIRSSTEVLLHQGEGTDSVNGIMVKTKIRGGGREAEDIVELPDSITIKTPLWVDEEEHVVELDLILDGSADGAAVFARIASADILEAEIEAFERLAERLREELDERFTVAHGKSGQGSWETVS